MVFFLVDGRQYRTNFDCTLVERLEPGGEWVRVLTGRIVRNAHMAVDAWVENVKRGGS